MTDREAEWAAPMGRLGLATAAEPNITTVLLLFHIITARQLGVTAVTCTHDLFPGDKLVDWTQLGVTAHMICFPGDKLVDWTQLGVTAKIICFLETNLWIGHNWESQQKLFASWRQTCGLDTIGSHSTHDLFPGDKLVDWTQLGVTAHMICFLETNLWIGHNWA